MQKDMVLQNDQFHLRVNLQRRGAISLTRPGDIYATDYLMQGKTLGDFIMRCRQDEGEWHTATANNALVTMDETVAKLTYAWPQAQNCCCALQVEERFTLINKSLEWNICLRNVGEKPLQIGDLGLILWFNTHYERDSFITYTQRVVKHSFISGPASFIYWLRANGIGSYLVMTTAKGPGLEHFSVDNEQARPGRWEGPYTAYIYSLASGMTQTTGKNWPRHTGTHLTACGCNGDQLQFTFRFHWADNYAAIRQILYDEGLVDIYVAPGMVIPSDLPVQLALRTKQQVIMLQPQYPRQTRMQYKGISAPDTYIYDVWFTRLGENQLTVEYGNGQRLYLEFFLTQPLETLIKKRAAFICNHQQHRQPDKWYNGLFSLWDMQAQMLLGPDNAAGLPTYMVGGSDDPCLSKALFLAVKNVVYPDIKQIAALEFYLQEFVWGKLQRTADEQPHPYGIYGSPNWYENRQNSIGYNSGGRGQERMWRSFDYTHLIMLYLQMYYIAKRYPHSTNYLDAMGYLERAYGSAKAFFTVPYNIKMGEPWAFRGWCNWAYTQGNFHERHIIELIAALAGEGCNEQANWLQGEWEKKARYFLHRHPYPYGSEMFFDTTAFESTHAIAMYARQHPWQEAERFWWDKNAQTWHSSPALTRQRLEEFTQMQLSANMASRSVIAPTYYRYGSDIRACGDSSYLLSYMSQLGGWAILDYALDLASESDYAGYLRLGYGALLSSWCLVNSGTAETNYGYWYPGTKNDGAAAWAYEPAELTATWAHRQQLRGVWAYDGEIDHGLAAGVNAAATIVATDPIFGMVAYGGIIVHKQPVISVIPRDGVRRHFHLLLGKAKLHISLAQDGFAPEQPINIATDLSQFAFYLESRVEQAHSTKLLVSGLPEGTYHVCINDLPQSDFNVKNGEEVALELAVEGRMGSTAIQVMEV